MRSEAPQRYFLRSGICRLVGRFASVSKPRPSMLRAPKRACRRKDGPGRTPPALSPKGRKALPRTPCVALTSHLANPPEATRLSMSAKPPGTRGKGGTRRCDRAAPYRTPCVRGRRVSCGYGETTSSYTRGVWTDSHGSKQDPPEARCRPVPSIPLPAGRRRGCRILGRTFCELGWIVEVTCPRQVCQFLVSKVSGGEITGSPVGWCCASLASRRCAAANWAGGMRPMALCGRTSL